MTDNNKSTLSPTRKIVIGLLSFLSIGLLGLGTYFLTRKTNNEDTNFQNKSNGGGCIAVGSFLLFITIIIAFNPTLSFYSHPNMYPNVYPNVYPNYPNVYPNVYPNYPNVYPNVYPMQNW